MAARAYWKGQIRLALVSIPVEIFTATKSGASIAFNQIHEPTGKRIKYEKVVPGVGPVDPDEIVKGYQYEKGSYVLLEDDEDAAADRDAFIDPAMVSGGMPAEPIRRNIDDREMRILTTVLCAMNARTLDCYDDPASAI